MGPVLAVPRQMRGYFKVSKVRKGVAYTQKGLEFERRRQAVRLVAEAS